MGSNRNFSKVSKKAFSWLLSAVLLSSCFSSMPVNAAREEQTEEALSAEDSSKDIFHEMMEIEETGEENGEALLGENPEVKMSETESVQETDGIAPESSEAETVGEKETAGESSEEITEPESSEEIIEPESSDEVTEAEPSEEATEPESSEEIIEPESSNEVVETEPVPESSEDRMSSDSADKETGIVVEESTEPVIEETEEPVSEEPIEPDSEETEESLYEETEESLSEELTEEETESKEELAIAQNVSIAVEGKADIKGIDKNGMAQIGSKVSITVKNPGEVLAEIWEEEWERYSYTALELDRNNCFTFTAEYDMSFIVVNPDEFEDEIEYSSSRKAQLLGEAGLKLNGLEIASAIGYPGYRKIGLDFTAVLNGNDGSETADTYYEVKVAASQSADKKYYYVKKTPNKNTQGKSIVIKGDTLTTSDTYAVSTRLVHISKTTKVPSETETPLETVLSGNTITKSVTIKDCYIEDKLGFTKKTTKIYTGQSDVLAGIVKYSKNASLLHNLTAIAYDSRGAVYEPIKCVFKDDKDELYLSVDQYAAPGKYTVTVYASVGEPETKYEPQGGTMYQANTSFALTVEPGINRIDTSSIIRQAAVAEKNSSFSAAPVGYSGYSTKAKVQKFTYEIKSAVKVGEFDDSDDNFKVTEPTDKVKNNISIANNGKVTIKKGYTVNPVTGEDYIAIVIKAADFENNEATQTVYIKILNTARVPTEIYFTGNGGKNLGTKFSVDEANYSWINNTYVWANVVVLDQFGNDMTKYVTFTPKQGKSSGSGNYVHQYSDGRATLYIHKLGTITVKAVSTDGGKKSKTVKLTVKVPEYHRALYSLHSITYNGNSVYNYKTGTGLVTYAAPKGSVIKIYQGSEINYNTHSDHTSDKRDCIGNFNRSWFNYDYEIEGGKVTFENNLWVITPTERTATLTTWQKSNPRQRSSVRFTNTNWSQSYKKAPKISLTGGKLYSSRYSTESEVYDNGNGYVEIPDQQLSFHYDSGDYDWIEIEGMSNKAPNLWVSDFDKRNRTFTLYTYAENINSGSYKYKVAFYKNNNNNVSDILASSTITVKVNKAPKFKIVETYTWKTQQADSVTLKCQPDGFIPDFETEVLNANIGGKSNDFSDYFEVVVSKDSLDVKRVSVKFKDTVTAEQKAAFAGKTITGYVKYSYYYGHDHIKNAVSKVTIKIK